MFSAIPSVYCSEPSHPGGVKSGQRPGPVFFEKSTRTPLARMSTRPMPVVIGQRATSRGEFRIVAVLIGTMSLAAAGPGFGFGFGSGVGVGAGDGVANAR